MMSASRRCEIYRYGCRPGILAAVSILFLLGAAQQVQAQHIFGINFEKDCPTFAEPGDLVTCTFQLENNDNDHAVSILSLTDQVPFGVPGFPDGPVISIENCEDENGTPLGAPPFQLAANDGTQNSGPDFATCDISYTIPDDNSLCMGTWIDQGEVTFQDVGIPVLVDTNQASGIIVIDCFCGDDRVNLPGETCDGEDAEGCTQECRPPGDPAECTCCGDGILNGGEFCDGGMADGCNEPCRDDCTCCGDGIVNGDEMCDDGNDVDFGDDCRNNCMPPICGDNIQDPDELCDGTDAADCNQPCRPPDDPDECTCCGDGIINGGEFCDDGNADNEDDCRNDCTACGDSEVQMEYGEECDDGNDDNFDDCRNDCTLPECGDNIIDPQDGETCDGTATDGCTQDCRPPDDPAECTCCGDGLLNGGEFCDGDMAEGCNEPCRDDCTCCGDGVVNGDELCDDGNDVDFGDDCRNNCTPPECGDGIQDPGESCDEDADEDCNAGQSCRDDCTCCGDDMINGDEFCDGPMAEGCNADCRSDCTCCGDGVINGDEDCDDGNNNNFDDCRNDCTPPFCGDGIQDPNEICDGDDAETCNAGQGCRPPGDPDECTCCGDDIVNGNEYCDGPSSAGCNEPCRNDCTCCGDGTVNGDEECDDGNDNNLDGCRNDCTEPFCGDGILDSGEECDGDAGACPGECQEDCTCPQAGLCRVTGGGNNITQGNRYTWGGQAGAPEEDLGQPCGEWTHRQHTGDGGKWTFHAGTSSAPPGTEIDFIECCDEGWCNPARPAPFKQITFGGVGTFKNIHSLPEIPDDEPEPIAGETFHWFVVHIEDLGEPGSHPEPDPDNCPEMGFNCSEGYCGCPDFYRITIHTQGNPGSPVLYEVYGYMGGGNHQIHPVVPGDHHCGPNGGNGGR